jgi:predicted TIM-barrel fold metal-dependent hydrolase
MFRALGRTNDRLHEAVQRHPDRFFALAVLPTANPRAAADELERAVTKLGFKGAMVNGMTDGVFHDDKCFWPIWERAAKLDVPIYIHPALPHAAVIEAYYKPRRHAGCRDWTRGSDSIPRGSCCPIPSAVRYRRHKGQLGVTQRHVSSLSLGQHWSGQQTPD